MPGMLLPQIAHRHPNLCEQLDMLESQVLAPVVKNASIQKPTLAKKHDSVNYRMKIISESADADLNLNTLNVHTKVLPMWERNTLQQCNIALPNLIHLRPRNQLWLLAQMMSYNRPLTTHGERFN